MIETLARKRTSVVAVAVLAALAVALFSVFGLARAAELGTCSPTGTNYMLEGDTCEFEAGDGADSIISSTATGTVEGVNTAGTVVVTAGATVGEATITDDNGTVDDNDDADETGDESLDDITYKFVVLSGAEDDRGSGAALVFSDTDAVVAAGTPVTVHVAMRYAGHETDDTPDAFGPDVVFRGGGLNFTFGGGTATFADDALVPQVRLKADPQPGAVELATVRAGVDGDSDGDFTDDGDVAPAPDWNPPTKLDGVATSRSYTINTAGAAEGTYTITATIGITVDGSPISAEKDLIIGQPGNEVAEVDLKLSTRGTSDTTDDEDGFAAKDGSIELEYVITNAQGSVANASGINVIQITGTDGIYSIGSQMNEADGFTVSPNAAKGTITVKSKQNKERSLTVTITAIGGTNVASDSITVSFTGSLDSITAGDVPGTLHSSNTAPDGDDDADKRDQLVIKFSGADASGNKVVISDAPEVSVKSNATGKTVAKSDTGLQQTAGETTEGRGYDHVVLENNSAAGSPLAAGEYTLTIKSGTKSTTVAFTVVVGADSVVISVDDMAPSALADVINVEATVLDAEGNAVADGTMVSFGPSTSDVVRRTGTIGDVGTKGGVAKATFVTVGAGTEVITAVTGGKSAAAVVVSTAGAVGAEPQEVGLDCLSETSGFSSYTCSMGSSASELFGLLSGRGATAIHLWNGSMWVRYAVVDGSEIPGSSDFTVAEDDILYISN